MKSGVVAAALLAVVALSVLVAWEGTHAQSVSQDTVPPVIILNGSNPHLVEINTPYVEPGAVATDDIDGDLTGSVRINSTAVDTSRLGSYVVEYASLDSSNNPSVVYRIVSVVDTTPPTIYVHVTAEATGNMTEVSIAAPVAVDNSGDAVTVINNTSMSSEYPVGTTDVQWGAIDSSGNRALVVQRVTVQDTTPPAVTPPADVSINATAVLTAPPQLGAASATDLVDGAPMITNDAPDLFPIGDTTITWNATDSSGNWATATQLVTVHADSLDSDWYYALRWHEGYWGHAAIAPTKHFDSLRFAPSDVGDGSMHLFKTFRTADIRSHGIAIEAGTTTPHNVTVYVMDGAYSKDVPSDFTLSGGPAIKGGGILASYPLSDMPKLFEPDWTRSQLDEATLVISLEKKVVGSPFLVHSVEFEGHSKWVFDDYKVEQRGNKGTYLLLPTSPSVHAFPVNDTFTGSLDGWTYWGYTSDYGFAQDNSTGRPSPSASIRADQFGVFAGMSKIVDISGMQDNQNLTLSYDYRASSAASYLTVTNSYLRVLDADTGKLLFKAYPTAGGTRDTGWRSYSTDLTDETSGSDRIEIMLGLYDSWIASFNQANWYDNVVLHATNQSDPSPESEPEGAAGASGGRTPAMENMTDGATDPNNWFTRLP